MYSVVLMMAMTTSVDTPDLGRRGGCHGGYGCNGSSCMGGYGCNGSSCHGGHGCHGGLGLFGGRRHGCHGGGHGCHGGGYGCHGGGYGCTGGGYGCTGGHTGCTGGVMVKPMPEPVKPMPKPDGKEAMLPAPATIVVSLPADAKLSIDDAATTSTSEVRTFVSPELPAGRDFSYTLKAEFQHEGKPVVVTKLVGVRAGLETRVTIGTTDLAASVASR